MLVDVALDERIGDDRLRAADVRPAPAERVAGDLRHREEMQHADVQAVQAARREVRDDVVVENGGQKRAAEELRERDVRLTERVDAVRRSDPASHRRIPRLSAA